MLANPYQRYKHNQVETVSPQQLIIMLYNGAIRFLKLAQAGLDENDIDKCHTNIIKTQDIVFELMNTLDMNQGEISGQLYLLYDYMLTRLLDGNLKKDKQPLAEVEGMLAQLRDTWAEAIRSAQ